MKITGLRQKIKSIDSRIWYACLTVITVLLYKPGVEILSEQEPSGYYIKSNITLNFIILFYIAGVMVDKYSKARWKEKKDNWKGWVLLIVVMYAMVLFFKYVGGYETIF
jgi:hypothetical protein